MYCSTIIENILLENPFANLSDIVQSSSS